jgi:hypothetical protein
MWVPTQSSNRDLAPGMREDGVLVSFFCRQSTASVYALRSLLESEPLCQSQSLCTRVKSTRCTACIKASAPNMDLEEADTYHSLRTVSLLSVHPPRFALLLFSSSDAFAALCANSNSCASCSLASETLLDADVGSESSDGSA